MSVGPGMGHWSVGEGAQPRLSGPRAIPRRDDRDRDRPRRRRALARGGHASRGAGNRDATDRRDWNALRSRSTADIASVRPGDRGTRDRETSASESRETCRAGASRANGSTHPQYGFYGAPGCGRDSRASIRRGATRGSCCKPSKHDDANAESLCTHRAITPPSFGEIGVAA